MKNLFKYNIGKWKTKKTQKVTALLILTLVLMVGSTNAIIKVKATPASIFEDSFESNNLNSWDQTHNNYDGTIRTVSTIKYSGNYGAEFIANSYNGYQFVSLDKEINSRSELYARAYINININGLSDSEDKLYFIRFSALGNNVLFAGCKLSGSAIRWQLLIRDGSGYRSEYSTSSVATNEWYYIEAYWREDGYNGGAKLWINGNEEISIDGQDTNNYGSVTKVQFGVAEAYRIEYSRIYGDNFAISDEYIGPINQPQEESNQPTNDESSGNSVAYTPLVSDDFESRTLDKWSGTETSYRETVRVHNYRPYEGRYHSRFYTSGSSATENAYIYKTTNLDNAYAKGYFYVIQGFPLSNEDDRFYLISFSANRESVAGIGIRMDNGEMKWTAYAKDGSSTFYPTFEEDPVIHADEWYLIELYWQKDSNLGKVEVQINGEKIFEISNIDTNYYGNVDEIQMGTINSYSVQQSMIVYGDNFEVGSFIQSSTEPSNNEPTQSPSPSEPTQEPNPAPSSTPELLSGVFNGLSGYPTSTSQIDQIIKVMDDNNLNVYRMSFSPEWNSYSRHAYHASYVQYFLDHCDFTLIVDRNHIYPPTEDGAQEARNNWNIVENSIFEVLRAWPNNPRVGVDLINEYVSSDFYSRMQDLVNDIRSAGYTNPIVVNKWSQSWRVINDPMDNTYQGYHFYFNSWSVSGAVSQMENALSKGIKIINTEVGADFNGYRDFDSSEVRELNDFIQWCTDRGISNAVWVNENLMNWPRYEELGIDFP